jgi:hypothetical protein
MQIIEMAFIVVGLSLFEIISSIDNAIINGEVLSRMSARARRWFLIWGVLIAVFVIRGLLPFGILWASNPQLSGMEVFSATLTSDPHAIEAMEQSAGILLAGGGTFLIFLFFHWLFLEPKHYGLRGERTIQKSGFWFYAVVSVLLAAIVWLAVNREPMMAFGAVVGSTAFFITHGFKENAEQMEGKMLTEKKGMSDISKLLYLEAIDATFSIDGVLGAFAFTLSIPLILIGNGIGAVVVRQLSVKNIENVKKYKYLKNGAMYSVLALGAVMLFEAFGMEIPSFVTPIMTIAIVGYFFWKSVKALRVETGKK